MERLVYFLVISGLLAAGYVGLRRLQVIWLARSSGTDPLLTPLRGGVPAIVYFTSPYCAPCRSTQRPAIERLQVEMGEALQVIEVDATQDVDAANRWGVLSVPTTFVLDGRGIPREVNHGVAGMDRLKLQLQRI